MHRSVLIAAICMNMPVQTAAIHQQRHQREAQSRQGDLIGHEAFAGRGCSRPLPGVFLVKCSQHAGPTEPAEIVGEIFGTGCRAAHRGFVLRECNPHSAAALQRAAFALASSRFLPAICLAALRSAAEPSWCVQNVISAAGSNLNENLQTPESDSTMLIGVEPHACK
jgi:hypothetical protein